MARPNGQETSDQRKERTNSGSLHPCRAPTKDSFQKRSSAHQRRRARGVLPLSKKRKQMGTKNSQAVLLRDQVLLPICSQHRLESFLDSESTERGTASRNTFKRNDPQSPFLRHHVSQLRVLLHCLQLRSEIKRGSQPAGLAISTAAG